MSCKDCLLLGAVLQRRHKRGQGQLLLPGPLLAVQEALLLLRQRLGRLERLPVSLQTPLLFKQLHHEGRLLLAQGLPPALSRLDLL